MKLSIDTDTGEFTIKGRTPSAAAIVAFQTLIESVTHSAGHGLPTTTKPLLKPVKPVKPAAPGGNWHGHSSDDPRI